MTKQYCDKCSQEMTLSHASIVARVHVGMQTLLYKVVSDQPHKKDICRDCILNALLEVDDRPKTPTNYEQESH